MFWIAYTAVVLLLTGLVGFHLGRFREAYTEMTGMMAGMTMGMINGFLLGYAAAAIAGSAGGATTTVSLFWGNLFGILLGVTLGAYFGRVAGLMGIMDGSMGGLMGGSMGAMLAAMLAFPGWALYYTAILLLVAYVGSMLGLVALIEKSAPSHAALHVILPYFTPTLVPEAAELAPNQAIDHYKFLGIERGASEEQITAAYLVALDGASAEEIERAERALVILTDPVRRATYDRGLDIIADSIRPACCPPPRKKKSVPAGEVNPALNAPASAQTASTPRSVPAASSRRSVPIQRRAAGPGPIIGGGVAVLVILGLLSWFVAGRVSGSAQINALTDSGRALPAGLVQKIQAEAVSAMQGSDGKQTVNFSINGDTRAYKPQYVRVKVGIPVHFNLKTEGKDPGCGRVVSIQALNARGVAIVGQTTSMEFTPMKPGIFQINCEMHMMDPGYIIVE